MEPRPAVRAGKVPTMLAGRGPIADGEIVVLVELGPQDDPEPRGIQVVVGALDQQLPAHRAELLGGRSVRAKAVMPPRFGFTPLLLAAAR